MRRILPRWQTCLAAGFNRVRARRPHTTIVLDMDSSVSETHGVQEGSTYNGHFGCTCYHPLFVFNQFGDLERCSLGAPTRSPARITSISGRSWRCCSCQAPKSQLSFTQGTRKGRVYGKCRFTPLALSVGYLNKKVFVLCSRHDAAGDGDDREGNGAVG